MKRAVRVLRRAQVDLQRAYDFVARETPLRANRFVDHLLDKIESLGTLADRGSIPRDKTLARHGYRFIVCKPYLVFYKVLPRQVRVYRVLHGKRAYRELL